MSYTLYNKTIGTTLDVDGKTWMCETLEEAREMLAACKECVKTYPDLDEDNFVIIEADTGEQIS
jgi:hypothetical protein